MRVVGLISGGKDSMFNMMQCVAEGHEIVALANLRPCDKDEIDSYMYQTVGHHAVDLIAEAMDLPLYRRTISGKSLEMGGDYTENADDEVEDLFMLLKHIKDDGLAFDAVAVGAILSDYQRVRVENVCSRLSLTVLAYLWRRDQKELLLEMINCELKAILIKVASLGLTPDKQLGCPVDQQFHDYMTKMSEKYGLNMCGEGGEYETFTLDCPLFLKRLVLDDVEVVMHSNDAFAPVAFLNLKKLHLEEKQQNMVLMSNTMEGLPLKRNCDLLTELYDTDDLQDESALERSPMDVPLKSVYMIKDSYLIPEVCSRRDDAELIWMSGFVARRNEGLLLHEQISAAIRRIAELAEKSSCSLADVVAVSIYVSDMSDFGVVNEVYKTFFVHNPPVRACVEAPLPADVSMIIDCVAYTSQNVHGETSRRSMHVQSISHWAPANIGPYSQCVMLGHHIYVAGQIGLCPASMTLVDGGAPCQSRLSLRHLSRILDAMSSGTRLHDITVAICYVTTKSAGQAAEVEWRRALGREFLNVDDSCTETDCETILPPVVYVLVHALPRQAVVEWQVAALKNVEHWQGGSDSTSISNSLFTVSYWWKFAGNVNFLSYLITIAGDTCNSVQVPLPCVIKLVSSALECLRTILAKFCKSYRHIGGLRLLVSTSRLNINEVFTVYQSAFQTMFECGADSVVSAAVVPVCDFASQSSGAVLCLCSA